MRSMLCRRSALHARLGELVVDRGDEPVEPGLVLRLGAGDEDVLRVRCAQQPPAVVGQHACAVGPVDLGARRREARERSEEHTSELQSLMRISYAVFCLKKKTQITYMSSN